MDTNASALDARQAEALAVALAPLGSPWTERVVRFVASGDGTSLVRELAANPDVANRMPLKTRIEPAAGEPAQWKMEAVFERPFPQVEGYIRLGTVLAVLANASPRNQGISVPGAPPWLTILLWEASSFEPRSPDTSFRCYLTHQLIEGVLVAAGFSADIILRATLRAGGDDGPVRTLLLSMGDAAGALQRHPEAARAALQGGWPEGTLQLLCTAPEALRPLLPQVAELVLVDSQATRELATACLRLMASVAVPVLAELMARQGAKPLRARVQRALEAVARLPPADQGPPPLSPQATAVFSEAVRRTGQQAGEHDRGQWYCKHHDEIVERCMQAMTTACPDRHVDGRGELWPLVDELDPFLRVGDVTLAHVVRLAAAIGALEPFYGGLLKDDLLASLVTRFQAHRSRPFALEEVARELAELGVTPQELTSGSFSGWSGLAFPEEVLAVFLAEHPECLEDPLSDRIAGRDQRVGRSRALRFMAMMPEPPARFVPQLWDIALGSARAERREAQLCVEKLPGAHERVLERLQRGTQAEREVAAAWLADLGRREDIEPLRAALAKEKGDRGKAALMSALERLGAGLDDLVDRGTLAAEARRGLARGIPEGLQWFPFDRLPVVRWRDGGQLEREVATWWIVQALKLGKPEPSPMLRMLAARLDPRESRAFGGFVLRAWVACDTARPTEAEVEELAKTSSMAQWMPHDELLKWLLTQPKQSAVPCKGILAVPAAMGADEAPAVVSGFLKEWYGMRAAQCRALLRMLSWMEDPAATGVVLATASRFRTASIRKEAEDCVQELAQRRGWTIDELADRTVPSAGFDDEGTLELSYGQRTFRARLGDDLEVTLENAAGESIARLPEPAGGDDEQAAAAAKKALADARKQLKALVKQQSERLRDAMCAERVWTAADWRQLIAGHQIMGRLCRRLVWLARGAGDAAPVRAFRPLGDGTLSAVDDSPVTLGDGDRVQLAHALLLSGEEASAWRTHLHDYEVVPLLDQLGRTPFVPSEAQARATELRDHEGHLVRTFRLRSRATSLGYVRGPTGDGGWYSTYERRFPQLRLTAEVEFSGSPLPETDRLAALVRLQFLRDGRAQALGQLPRVLLSECWNDLHAMAADGPGHDADWQSKIQQQ